MQEKHMEYISVHFQVYSNHGKCQYENHGNRLVSIDDISASATSILQTSSLLKIKIKVLAHWLGLYARSLAKSDIINVLIANSQI